MPERLSHGDASRERIAPNVYRRRTKRGDVVFEAMFRDVDGRSKTKRLKARTERDAKREARALLAKRDGGDRVVAKKITLRAFVESEWLKLIDSLAKAGRRAEQGVKTDRNVWRLYIEPTLGDLRLGEIDGADVARMLRELRERSHSESTCKSALSTLSAIYRLARKRKIVTRSPIDELDPSERPRSDSMKNGRRLDERELDALVRHASGPDVHRVGVAILAYTGMRVSEALALTWDRIDFVDREVLVACQLTRATRRVPARVVPRKHNGEPYYALMFESLERVLTEHLERELEAGRGSASDFVLVSERTRRPLHQRTLSFAVEDAATSAGLGHVTPQTLRGSFASLAARRGVDPVQAAKMTGHSLDVWTRYYASDYGKPQRDEARARMSAHGFGAPSESETDENESVPR